MLVILAIQDSFSSKWVAVGLAGLAVLAVLFLGVFLAVVRRQAAMRVVVVECQQRDMEAMSYIVTYLIPFLGISLKEPATAASLGILFLVIAVIYVSSNMVHINPILNLLRFHLVEVHLESGKTATLISRRSYVRPGTELSAHAMGNYVLLETKK